MNNAKILYNAALVFGLVTTAPVLAEDVTTVDPSTMTREEREAYRAQRQSEMSGMTPEQRSETQSRKGQGQGQGTMARDGSGTGGQYGRGNGGGGMGGGHGKGR